MGSMWGCPVICLWISSHVFLLTLGAPRPIFLAPRTPIFPPNNRAPNPIIVPLLPQMKHLNFDVDGPPPILTNPQNKTTPTEGEVGWVGGTINNYLYREL